MSKIPFFHCTGTSYGFSLFDGAISAASAASGRWFWGDPSVNPTQGTGGNLVAGLGGKNYSWDGEVFNDPFPFMLNPDVWEPIRVVYPAANATFLSGGTLVGGMGASIDAGISKVIARINALPLGTPFALGGYSQGAAVMSGVYNELRSGSLTSRFPSFIGGTMFGNPRRQVNHRGEVGGTWSGAWDDPGSNSGGHGSFPATGPWARLSGCDGTKWIEFTAPDDIISSTGDTPTGTRWTQGNDALLGLFQSEYTGTVLFEGVLGALFPGFVSPIVTAINQAFTLAGRLNFFEDVTGNIGSFPGAGHVIYPVLPPPSSSGVIPTLSRDVTTTFNATGATTNRAGTGSRRGRTPAADSAPVSITKTYLRPNGLTCYQIALTWLEAKAAAYARAPILLPAGSVGWSTTLVPPAT